MARIIAFVLAVMFLAPVTVPIARRERPTLQAAATQQALPARLSNAEFWNLIATYSEPGGSFASENFASNEMSIGQLSTELRARGKTGGAYIGVGPEQNFTYIAALRPQVAFIVDIRRMAVIQHLMYKAVFELSRNRSEFIARLFSFEPQPQSPTASISQIWDGYLSTKQDSVLFERNLSEITRHLTVTKQLALSNADVNTLAYVYSAFYNLGPGISYRGYMTTGGVANASPGSFGANSLNTDIAGVERSFLANEDDFQFVKGMHERNMFIPVVGDISGPMALRAVAKWLRDRSTKVSAYYVSNVEEYLCCGTNLALFHDNALTLPLDSSSVFIRPAIGNPNAIKIDDRFYQYQVASLQRARAANAPVDPIAASRGRGSAPPAGAPATAAPAQNPLAGLLTGRVVDSATTNGLASVRVSVLGTTLAATTTSTGHFVIPNVPAGTHVVLVTRIGFTRKAISDVRIVASSSRILEVKLERAPLVQVPVPDLPVRGANVAIRAPRQHVPLCPMVPFLAAHDAGRIIQYLDVTTCTRL